VFRIGFALAVGVAPALFAAGNLSLPEGDAKKTVEAACSSCHGLEIVVAQKWSRPEWADEVRTMVERGAPLPKEKVASVVDYLARNFGKKDRGRELFEDVCSYCHSLQKVRSQELSKEEWGGLIKGMISEGAPVTDEEFNLILDYLAKNYGKKDP
jgi:cytochrome c5